MWVINFILDHIPLWLYVVIVGGGSAVLLYFCYPILIPIWNILPRWVKITLGFLLALTGAVFAGRYKGAKDERDAEKRRDAEAIQKRTEVDREVSGMSDTDAQKRLRDRWGRD